MKFTNIKDRLPPIGVPLIVKTFNAYEQKWETKYPVYSLKEPYEDKYSWFFMPVCEGICKLLAEDSKVVYWVEIHRLSEDLV